MDTVFAIKQPDAFFENTASSLHLPRCPSWDSFIAFPRRQASENEAPATWRYVYTEPFTGNYQTSNCGISAGTVRIARLHPMRKETTKTRRLRFVLSVWRCITRKDASGRIWNYPRLAHIGELGITKPLFF